MNSQKKFGPIISTLVIILIVIIAALYLFASKSDKEPIPSAEEETAAGTVETVSGSSTEPSDLQNDLNNAVQGLENI